MTPRENVLEVINWGNPEYVPIENVSHPWLVSADGAVEQKFFGGVDGFGVNWVVSHAGNIPQPGQVIFEDICDWREKATFPNLDDYDYEAFAQTDLPLVDRETQLVNPLIGVGVFDRLVDFMGFENALCALALEPDECKAFFERLTDVLVDHTERIIKAYKPDMITFCDDIAHANGLFMSLDCYRELIKPCHKRIADKMAEYNVIMNMHVCGKCVDALDDFVEIGVKVWNSAQIMNDLQAVQKKYAGKLVVEGGWDSSGPAGFVNASMETVMAECDRCLKEYGVNKGFIMWPVIMNENGNGAIVGDPRLSKILEVWPQISAIY